MKIIPLAQQVISKLALIGLLFAPFALTPSYAAELVGKPVAVGAPITAVTSSAQTSSQSLAATESGVSASAPAAPIAPEPSVVSQDEDNQVVEDIREAMSSARDNFHQEMPSGHADTSFNPDLLIPIVAMLLLFGGPIILVVILVMMHYRAKTRRQQNINMNIDKLLAAGKDIPVELLLGEEVTVKTHVRSGVVVSGSRDDSAMQKGVRNIGLGIGWLVFLTILFSIKVGAFGFVLIGLGISQLVIWKLSRPATETAESLKAQD